MGLGARIATFVLAALALTGCAAPAGQVAVDERIPSAACSFTYPDGAPIPCADRAERLDPLAQLGPSWICQSAWGTPDLGAKLHRDLQSGRFAVETWQASVPSSEVVARYDREGAEPLLMRWTNDGPTTAIALPAAVAEGDLGLRMFTVQAEVVGGSSADLDFSVLTSAYEGDFWFLYRAALGGAESYHDPTRVVPYQFAGTITNLTSVERTSTFPVGDAEVRVEQALLTTGGWGLYDAWGPGECELNDLPASPPALRLA